MRNDLKDLLVAIRRNMPKWVDGAAISMTLTPAPPEGDIVITINGVPPNDICSVVFLDDPEKAIVIRNWGVTVVEQIIEEAQENS